MCSFRDVNYRLNHRLQMEGPYVPQKLTICVLMPVHYLSNILHFVKEYIETLKTVSKIPVTTYAYEME